MRSSFDRRVVPEELLDLVRESQRRVPCRLGGGAALSGAYLAHRLSRDLDLVCSTPDEVRALVRELPEVARATDAAIELVQDAATFVRARVRAGEREVDLDVMCEGTPDIEPPPAAVDGIVVLSLADLRAAKLTCILSRSEPRYLVDLHFLDRAGFPPEADLPLALRKDAGIDPGVLAWLLNDFPLDPLPEMLQHLDRGELARFRDDLRERLRRIALPDEERDS